MLKSLKTKKYGEVFFVHQSGTTYEMYAINGYRYGAATFATLTPNESEVTSAIDLLSI